MNAATALGRGEQAVATGTPLGAETRATLDFTRLFVELANPHFFLDTASFDQLAEAADGLLGRFLIA
jgi:hypothetical protein